MGKGYLIVEGHGDGQAALTGVCPKRPPPTEIRRFGVEAGQRGGFGCVNRGSAATSAALAPR
jgi:hypothetical protein